MIPPIEIIVTWRERRLRLNSWPGAPAAAGVSTIVFIR